ncbi:hypothetical protein OIU77_024153 [Salix suchowensis]|uniref:dUTP diphosphatase n=1 Tax=Salix suchowensis TaxID=1278906 RepID=A0ABQ9BTV7_9ROSI|nr:hypothetical protein OIU77_024153 [Salix suchowensis]
MLKVLTILFRCHRSGFCQNQARANLESSPLPAYGNHSDNTEEMHDQKKKDVFRPSLLDMETGRRDRWRDEERDTNSSLRKDRWRDGDKELGDSLRMDRWPENSSLFRVKRLSENVVLPSRGSPLSAGCDLSSVSAAKVPARGIALIPTDLSIAIPEGTYARIAPRSGLTWKHSIDVGAGVIDADYRGPVGVILFNHSDLDFEVKVGDKISHLIIQKIVTPNVMEVEDLDATVRGAGGFGNSFRVKRLSENAVLPSRGSPLSAGCDLSSVSAAKVPARGIALIPTDLSIAIPEGTYARIAPRSGLTWKHSIDVGAGVIDADYRGPVGVILFNHSDLDFEVKVGDKISHLIIQKIVTPNVMEVEDLDATVRGAGGFGNSFRVKRLSENAVLPSRGSPLSAGYDLSSVSATKVPARGIALIPTDLSIAIPEGTYARIAPRSGLTWKHSIDVGEGVIHADYQGPVGVILFNHSDVDFEVKVGDRIAQLIIEMIVTPNGVEVEDLDATVRGAGGFGNSFRVKRLSENAVLPSRGYPLSAGYDLSSVSAAKVPARGKAIIPTDLSIAVPEGTYARIASRSGLTWKHSIDVGGDVIDADYRGPVGVILFNHSDLDFEVKVGDRIAQLILQKIMTPNAMEVEDLDATVRGAGGFGSTGVRA